MVPLKSQDWKKRNPNFFWKTVKGKWKYKNPLTERKKVYAEKKLERKRWVILTCEVPRLVLINIDLANGVEAKGSIIDLALQVIAHKLFVRWVESKPRCKCRRILLRRCRCRRCRRCGGREGKTFVTHLRNQKRPDCWWG